MTHLLNQKRFNRKGARYLQFQIISHCLLKKALNDEIDYTYKMQLGEENIL